MRFAFNRKYNFMISSHFCASFTLVIFVVVVVVFVVLVFSS